MPSNPAWQTAFSAALRFTTTPCKADELTEGWSSLAEADRRRAYRLFHSWLRNRGVAEAAMAPFLRRPPRPKARVLLELALAEVAALADPQRHPAAVHHAVEAAKRLLSEREVALVNAILRRAAPAMGGVPLRASHPTWLVDRWTRAFGPGATESLLAWNQHEAPNFVRWPTTAPPPAELEPTDWAGFFRIPPERMGTVLEAVGRGQAYIQDPFARHPVQMALAGHPRTVLDLCAAPGGKTRALLDLAAAAATDPVVVAVDLPGPRLARLRENLACAPQGASVRVLGQDVRRLTPTALEEAGLPTAFDAVLLDVPCSNTGVIRRRPDVRWLLQEAQFDELCALQGELLEVAASLVAPGGVLVYSTCSLEAEENERRVEAFLAAHPDFELGTPRLSRPWVDHHDGGGAFPLTRLNPPK